MLRTIQFHRLVQQLGGAALLPDFDGYATLEILASLDVAAGEAHLDTSDGLRLLGRVLENPVNGPHLMALYRIRHSDLPSLEQSGQILDLNLPANQGLAEAVHLRFFPNSVIGVLYNYDGPRPSRIPEYLNAKGGLDPRVGLQPLIRRDVIDQLNEMDRINLISVKIPVSEIAAIQQADQGLYTAVNSAAQVGSSKWVALDIRFDPVQHPGVTERAKAIVTSIVTGGQAGRFDRFKVRGRSELTESTEMLDVLAEQITVQANVEPRADASRTVSDDSARSAIGDAYAQSEAAIAEALGIPPP